MLWARTERSCELKRLCLGETSDAEDERSAYISGPVFLIGAFTAGLLAADILPSDRGVMSAIATGTTALALASFLPEFTWRKYL